MALMFKGDLNVAIPAAAAEEAELQFDSFSNQIAWDLGTFMRSRWAKVQDPSAGALLQIRSFPSANSNIPNIVFSCFVGKETATNAGSHVFANAKSNVVQMFAKSSFRMGLELDRMHLQPEVFGLRFPEHLTHGGGFPIHLKNNSSGPVGAILVSGLPSEEDHKMSPMLNVSVCSLSLVRFENFLQNRKLPEERA